MFDDIYWDVASKIKVLAKWILIIGVICSVVGGGYILLKFRFADAWYGLLIVAFGIIGSYVSSLALYAIGQVAEETHYIKTQLLICQNNGKNADYLRNDDYKKEQLETNHDVKNNETLITKDIKISNDKKEIREKLLYALKFQTDSGMINYLKTIENDDIQEILKSPSHLIREKIKEMLDKE